MTVTVVTLVDNFVVETYVGTVIGTLSEEERRAVAKAFRATYVDAELEASDEDVTRELYFREVDLASGPEELRELLNASDQGTGGAVSR